jgi:hypothetical protein
LGVTWAKIKKLGFSEKCLDNKAQSLIMHPRRKLIAWVKIHWVGEEKLTSETQKGAFPMAMKTTVLRVALLALLVGAVATVPALAGSAVIGSVAGSMNATVGGQSLLPNTTIFSGDSLQVRDGVAVIAVGNDSRVIFGRDTVASFLRESNEVTVLLSQGDVSMLHPNDGTPVRVKAGEISITPAAGFKTLGEVAMLNGSVVITAKEGELQVEDHGATKNVAKGQTIVIAPKTANNGGGGNGWSGSTTLEVVTLAAAGAGAILAGVAMSRAGSANTAANSAISAANAATSAATTANSTAATAAASAAAAAASAAQAQYLASCANDFLRTGNTASATQLSGGSQCPNYNPYP